MHTFEVTKEIAVPVDQAWAVLRDFPNTYVHHPIVERSGHIDGPAEGVGCTRECHLYSGGRVAEAITRFDDAGRSYDVEVVDHGPFPMKHMEVTIEAQSAGVGRSRITYRGGFVPKFGPMGWMMAKTMMVEQFESMMGQLIDGLESHVQTGRIVGKDGALQAAA
jgi:carbon monoxide dehydrogenase subunit G